MSKKQEKLSQLQEHQPRRKPKQRKISPVIITFGRGVTKNFIDGIGQIHQEESGLALIQGADEFEAL